MIVRNGEANNVVLENVNCNEIKWNKTIQKKKKMNITLTHV
jgi:hypothetical protein